MYCGRMQHVVMVPLVLFPIIGCYDFAGDVNLTSASASLPTSGPNYPMGASVASSLL